MAKILASVQSGQFSDEQIKQLEALLRRNYAALVSDEKLVVVWNILPEGQVWTNYKPSRSSIIGMECTEGFDQEKRELALKTIADEWSLFTGQDKDEIMLSLFESPLFNEILQANDDRLTGFGKLQFKLHMVGSLIRSKFKRGFLSFSPNL